MNNIVRKISLHYSSGKFEEQALRDDITDAEQQLKEMEIEAAMLDKSEKAVAQPILRDLRTRYTKTKKEFKIVQKSFR